MPFDSPNPRISKRRMNFAMLLAAAVVLALLASSQRAIAKGVFFDPNSPAGKEYALPLEQAREEAAGVGTSDGPAGKQTQLFGEGVTPRRSGPGANSGRGGESSAGRQRAPGGSPAGGPGQGSQPLRSDTAAISSADDHYPLSNALLWIAAVLAVGGAASLALRAVQRPRHT